MLSSRQLPTLELTHARPQHTPPGPEAPTIKLTITSSGLAIARKSTRLAAIVSQAAAASTAPEPPKKPTKVHMSPPSLPLHELTVHPAGDHRSSFRHFRTSSPPSNPCRAWRLLLSSCIGTERHRSLADRCGQASPACERSRPHTPCRRSRGCDDRLGSPRRLPNRLQWLV